MFPDILLNIIAPVFILILLGALMDRLFSLDIKTLTKLNFYVIVTSVLFVKLQSAEIDLAVTLPVAGFVTLLILLLFGLSFLFKPLIKDRAARIIASQASIFMNCGNMGIPLLLSAFGDRSINIVIIIIIVQNILMFTLGIALFQKDRSGWLHILKVPALYAIAAGLACRFLQVKIPFVIMRPLEFVSGAFIPTALFTLGIQIHRTGLMGKIKPLVLPLMFRLLLSPLIAFFLLKLFPLEREVKDILLVASGLPPAVNIHILALEYGGDRKLAAQVITWGTILSALTLSLLLYLVRLR